MDNLKQHETIEMADVDVSISDNQYANRRLNAYQVLSAEKKMHGQQALVAVKNYLFTSSQIRDLRDQVTKIREQKNSRDSEVQMVLNNMQRLALHISNGDAVKENPANDLTFNQIKNQISFQLKNLVDKCTSEQLNRLESGLEQLQKVFDGVQIALREELMEHGSRASLLQPNSSEQQRILRATRGDVDAVLEAAKGNVREHNNLLEATSDIQKRTNKDKVHEINPESYWWNKY